MKFAPKSKRRSDLRRVHQLTAPAVIENLEDRMLLTLPEITIPDAVDGVFTDSRPEITWEAVPGAVSYDLWISSLESFETIQTPTGIVGTSFTPTEQLTLGDLRFWARARFADDSTTAWTTGLDLRLESVPEVTGPVGAGVNNVTGDTTPTIEWDAAPGANFFQVFIRDDTAVTGSQVTIDNTMGEIREWTVPDEDALQFGEYTTWVRSIDASGRISEWSDPFKFDVGPAVTIIGPSAPSFDSSPLLQWEAVERANEYEVYLIAHDFDTPVTDGAIEPLIHTTVTETSFQVPSELPDGGYAFWVRAIRRVDGMRTVIGVWGSATQFATIRPPVITVPSAVDHGGANLTTEPMPTVEWTRIDGAARYEIWVEKPDEKPPFLTDTSSTNSYTFEDRLPEGTYFIWVRAVDTRGGFGEWSTGYILETSGGRPLITSPVQDEMAVDFTFEWIGFDDAVSYEIWIDWVGVDFSFVTVDGIVGTTYTHPDPFAPGNYRVWVRAMFGDGTFSFWSLPTSFEAIVGLEPVEEAEQPAVLLASVETQVEPITNSRADAQIPVQPPTEADAVIVAEKRDETDRPVVRSLPVMPPTGLPTSEADGNLEALPAELLARLAEQCVNVEWWELPKPTA